MITQNNFIEGLHAFFGIQQIDFETFMLYNFVVAVLVRDIDGRAFVQLSAAAEILVDGDGRVLAVRDCLDHGIGAAHDVAAGKDAFHCRHHRVVVNEERAPGRDADLALFDEGQVGILADGGNDVVDFYVEVGTLDGH